MKVRILQDVSGCGYFVPGVEYDAAVAPDGTQAYVFSNSSCGFVLTSGQFQVVVATPNVSKNFLDTVGGKPKSLTIEFFEAH